ncbi:MAG: hypothetical protein LBC67_06895 [Spirochaetales bacterium]|jgi:hypothetical protein|nr:hypothetical protein [Spirochaetales bacterium]
MKKTIRLKTLAAFCLMSAGIMGFAACPMGMGGDDETPRVYEVYTAGSQYDGSNYIACYWKDGVKTVLGETGKKSYANAIAVVEK